MVHFFSFKKKCFQNKLLLIPLIAQPYNFCSNGPTGLKCVMCIHPRHAEPTTKFCLKIDENCSCFQLFQKKMFKCYNFSRLCSNLVWEYLQSYFISFFRAHGSHAPMFFCSYEICPSHSITAAAAGMRHYRSCCRHEAYDLYSAASTRCVWATSRGP